MRRLLFMVLLLCSARVQAADNTVILTPGVGVTMRTTDVGSGRQSPLNILGDTSGNAIYGAAGTANANVITVQGIASGTVVPVSLASTTITGTVAATQSGTWTVQPGNTANTTPWLLTGSGTAGTAATGVVTVQGIASMTKLLVTPDSVALPANQSVNVSQINAVTPLTGNGVTGTGSQRVTVASDNTAFSVNAVQSGTWNVTNVSGTVSLPTGAATSANQTTRQAATGAAPPSNAVYLGANASGATGGLVAGLIQCDSTAIYDASTNGSTELKALTSGRSVYVCGYTILGAGTVNVKLIYGTGTACATGSNNMTPAFQLTTQVGAVDGSPFYRGMKTASANALCINTSAGVAVQAVVYYSVI